MIKSEKLNKKKSTEILYSSKQWIFGTIVNVLNFCSGVNPYWSIFPSKNKLYKQNECVLVDSLIVYCNSEFKLRITDEKKTV